MADNDEGSQEQAQVPSPLQNRIAAGGVSVTAGAAIASILTSLGTDGLATVVVAVTAAVVGTLGALGRRRR